MSDLYIFATSPAGNVPAAELDANFSSCGILADQNVWANAGPADWATLNAPYNVSETNVNNLPIECQFGAGTTPLVQSVIGMIDFPNAAAPPSFGNGAGVVGIARTDNDNASDGLSAAPRRSSSGNARDMESA